MERDPEARRRHYRLPSRDAVKEAIGAILEDAKTVRSQTLFHRLVEGRLRKDSGPNIRISQRRMRRIAATMDGVHLLILCRESERRSRRSICPVCGTEMRPVKNSTLYGWTVATGKACPACRYWTGKRERVPIRYVFTIDLDGYGRSFTEEREE